MTHEEALEAAKRFLSALQQRNVRVERAYLYGSFVSGRADKWSDIDVAVVMPSFDGDGFDFKLTLMRIARDIDPCLEPHPFLADEFNADFPPAAEILKTGERII